MNNREHNKDQMNLIDEIRRSILFTNNVAAHDAGNNERYMPQDDARKEFNVKSKLFYCDLDELYNAHPNADDSYIWTIHEAEDFQYWASGTSSFVNRMGYYVAEKPVPNGVRIFTSSQCVYCDKEECVCKKCPTCEQMESYCECRDDPALD